jgi:hypothetical protein
MSRRRAAVPLFVFDDATNDVPRCINALHVQTFIPNPYGPGTLITFASGDSVTVEEEFQTVAKTLFDDEADG